MSDLKELIIGLIIAGVFWLCVDSCQNKSKSKEDTKPVYTEWEPTSTPQQSYSTNSQNSYNSHSSGANSNWNSTAVEETEYEYTYSESYSFNNNSHSSSDNYERWETEDIEGFYVKLDNCETDEQAQAISDKYYSGTYIEEGYYYYAKTTLRSGLYEVELADRVNSKFFKIKGSDYYIRFKWGTSLWRWDEGIMDVWGNRGTFYIKPN